MKMFRWLLVLTVLTVLLLAGASWAPDLVAPPVGDAPPFDTTSAMSLQAQTRSIGETFGPVTR